VGRELEPFLSDEAEAIVADQTERRRAGQRSTYEVDIVRPDGERRTLLVTAAPRYDQSGAFEGTFAVFRDITERRQMEHALQAYSDHLEDMVRERTQELREAQEKSLRQQKLAALGQLAGSINHELRGPLGNIKSGAYFLHMALEDPQEDVQETVDLLMNEVDRAEAIVRSLLNFVRTEEPDRCPVDVNDLLAELLDEVEIPEDVRVVREFDRDLPPVPADRQQLRQVFRNLITNAVEAMPQGGQLTVISEQSSVASGELPATSQQSSAASDRSLERPEDEPPITDHRSLITENWILVTIKDTGVGMSQEARERIFEPLFSTKSQGVGLGLALAQMLIEAHGGAIEVQSVEGQGSAFTVRLPLIQDRKGQPTAPPGGEA
jgi:signal transduction histidine kinase